MAKGAKGLSFEELSGFCSQMAMILNSGLSLYDGLEALAQTYRKGAAADMFDRLCKAYQQNGLLQESMRQDERWPRYLVEMTGIGEHTGRMEEVMNGLATYYGREGRISRAIINAVTYPLVLSVMMLLIMFVMIVKVLPVFRRVLANLGVDIADSGNVMMNLGGDIAWVVLAVMGLLVLLVLVCCLLLRTKQRANVLKLARKLFPPVRRISIQLAASRASSVLAMMLSSGFPLDEALRMVPAVLDDDMAKAQIHRVSERVEKGDSFGEALTDSGLFDELYNCMIRMGFSVGCADVVMAKVAHEYETRVEDDVANLVSTIEPTLVAALSIVIGAVLLSVMLPMAGIISSIL